MSADLYITSVAIRCENGLVLVVERPGRHHHVINAASRIGLQTVSGEQGFMTSTGVFVDRERALAIARAAGQIAQKHGNGRILFSEDLW